MRPFASDGDQCVVILPINNPHGGQDIEKSAFNKSTWLRQGDSNGGFLGVVHRGKSRQVQPKNRDVGYAKIGRQDKTMGTDLTKMVGFRPTLVPKDTYLNNEIGDTVRYIKEKFGSAPLLRAYNGALDALDESNRRWKEYYEEEARLQSIFEGDD